MAGTALAPFRQRVARLVDPPEDQERPDWYDVVMAVATVVSLVPLAFKRPLPWLHALDLLVTAFFTVDYLLRWATADVRLGKGRASFALYPLTPMAVVDLLSLLPGYAVLAGEFRALRAVRLLKASRYSPRARLVMRVIRRQRDSLVVAAVLASGYVVVSALVMFNVEPDLFDSFFEAVYWATISLTTIGYGDIAPTTWAGQLVTMLSSGVGIAVIALPAGIITAGFTAELEEARARKDAGKA